VRAWKWTRRCHPKTERWNEPLTRRELLPKAFRGTESCKSIRKLPREIYMQCNMYKKVSRNILYNNATCIRKFLEIFYIFWKHRRWYPTFCMSSIISILLMFNFSKGFHSFRPKNLMNVFNLFSSVYKWFMFKNFDYKVFNFFLMKFIFKI